MKNKILRYNFNYSFGASGPPSGLNIDFIQVQFNISIFPAGESPPHPTVQTIKNTCTTPLSHIWSCHTERCATPTLQMGSRLLKIYGMLRQICGRPWWTSSRFKWSLVMDRQMIVPYRLARVPVHALLWTVLCKIVVFKSHTHKHTVKRAHFCILILLLFARVCLCVCEREGVSVCVRDFPAVSAVRRSQCSSSLYPTQNSQPENCVSDVMSWLLKKP